MVKFGWKIYGHQPTNHNTNQPSRIRGSIISATPRIAVRVTPSIPTMLSTLSSTNRHIARKNRI